MTEVDGWVVFNRIKQVVPGDASWLILDMVWDFLEDRQDREITVLRMGVLLENPEQVLAEVMA